MASWTVFAFQPLFSYWVKRSNLLISGLEDVQLRHVRAGPELGPDERILSRGLTTLSFFYPSFPSVRFPSDRLSYPSFAHLWRLLDRSSNNQWNTVRTSYPTNRRPCTMMGRAHRRNCRQGLTEWIVAHMERTSNWGTYPDWLHVCTTGQNDGKESSNLKLTLRSKMKKKMKEEEDGRIHRICQPSWIRIQLSKSVSFGCLNQWLALNFSSQMVNNDWFYDQFYTISSNLMQIWGFGTKVGDLDLVPSQQCSVLKRPRWTE